MKPTKYINFIGGPGVGKSTTALGVAYNLKKRRLNIEYVAEYAKDVTWEGTHALLENQTHIFSEQFRRQFRLLGKVDFVVTDSPLILSCIYHEYNEHKLARPDYVKLVTEFYRASYQQFDNLTYLIKAGVRPYNPVGRNQTEVEARKVHEDAVLFMNTHGLPFTEIEPEDAGIQMVLNDLDITDMYPETVLMAKIQQLADFAWQIGTVYNHFRDPALLKGTPYEGMSYDIARSEYMMKG